MKIPSNNDPELAQWYLERGSDIFTNAVGLVLGLLFVIPPLSILLLPTLIPAYIISRRMKRVGQQMNRLAGRPDYERPLGVENGPFMTGWDDGPQTRYGSVPTKPPIEPIFN